MSDLQARNWAATRQTLEEQNAKIAALAQTVAQLQRTVTQLQQNVGALQRDLIMQRIASAGSGPTAGG